MSQLKKPFSDIDEQVNILKSRKLAFDNEEEARKLLLRNNYFTVVNGYKYPFLRRADRDADSKNDLYKEGASFEELFALFQFDCELRALLLKNILKVEHELRSILSYVFASEHSEETYPKYLRPENFDYDFDNKRLRGKKQEYYETLFAHIDEKLREQEAKHNPVLTDYQQKYNNTPPWVLVSFFSFGMLRRFYDCLSNKDQNKVAKTFAIAREVLHSYLSALNIFRNACAHNERIYDITIAPISRKGRRYNRVYVVILILKDMLDAASFMNFYVELIDIIEKLRINLKSISCDEILRLMGMPTNEAERKADLGPLERGSALSEIEFGDVLTHYILPIIPLSAALKQVTMNDPNRENRRCQMVEHIDGRVYFSQSITSHFSYYAELPDNSVDLVAIDQIRAHLITLVDHIHVFWNLSNLSSYGRDRVEIAFPTLCEQAYELTICSLLCRDSSEAARREYLRSDEDYRKMAGIVSPDERAELERIHTENRRELNYQLRLESVAQRSLYGIVTQFESWASKTYEGQKKTFGIVFCKKELPGAEVTFNYIDFLKTDYSATINDGIYSAVELYADGSFKSHLCVSVDNGELLPTIPYPFTGFAALCTKDKIGVLLTNSGDILIINDSTLCYTKHNGRWIKCMADSAIAQIKKELDMEDDENAAVIYQAITDVSFSRGGACIGIIQEDELPGPLETTICAGLLSGESKNGKLTALRRIISEDDQQKNFYELNRYLRRELLELDGAMVLSKSGLIHVIGTIIQLEGSGSDGGGRTAAAKQLSEYGISVKISQDGYIELYKNRETVLKIMT